MISLGERFSGRLPLCLFDFTMLQSIVSAAFSRERQAKLAAHPRVGPRKGPNEAILRESASRRGRQQVRRVPVVATAKQCSQASTALPIR